MALRPVVSVAAVHRALSKQRLDAYGAGSGNDVQALATYLWNMALANSLHYSLHVLEITLRNAIMNASLTLVDESKLVMPDVKSWLDAKPTLLLIDEERAVQKAKTYLGQDGTKRTPGHLIAKLGFGFWVQLTSRLYGDLRGTGPKLWPRGLHLAFPNKFKGTPKATHADREMLFNRLHALRLLRNRAAHHEPIWEMNLAVHYNEILDTIGWMNPGVVAGIKALDPFPAIWTNGYTPFNPSANRLLVG